MLEDAAKRRKLTAFLEKEVPDVYKNGFDFSRKREESSSLKDVLKLFQSVVTSGSDKSKTDAAIVNSDKMQQVLNELSDLKRRFSPNRKPAPKPDSSSSSSSSSSSDQSLGISSSSSSSSSDALLRGQVSPSKLRPPSPSSLARAWRQGLLSYSDVCLSASTYDLDLNSILQSASSMKSPAKSFCTPEGSKRNKSPGSTILNTGSKKGAVSVDDASSIGGKSEASSYFVDTDGASSPGSVDPPDESDGPPKLDPKNLNLFGKASLDKAAIKHVLAREDFLRKDGDFKQSSIKAWFDTHGGTILKMNYDIPPLPKRGSKDAGPTWGKLAEIACRIIIFQDDELRESLSKSFKKTPKSKQRAEGKRPKARFSSVSTTLDFDDDDTPDSVSRRKTRTSATKDDPHPGKILSRRRPSALRSESDSDILKPARGSGRSKKQRVCSYAEALASGDRRTGATLIPVDNAFDSLCDSDSDLDESPASQCGSVSGGRE